MKHLNFYPISTNSFAEDDNRFNLRIIQFQHLTHIQAFSICTFLFCKVLVKSFGFYVLKTYNAFSN